jgi:hypothetical protein
MTPLRVCFDESCSADLRRIITDDAARFVASDAPAADVIVFGTDEVDYIRGSQLYRAYRRKSICMTETDTPTFRLRGLYAANARIYLARKRTRTMSYFISDFSRGNAQVQALAGQQVEKRYLYSFMGGSNSWPRKHIFRTLQSSADTVIEATHAYNHWTEKPGQRDKRLLQMRRFAEVMAASKFVLCPRGCGLSSYRLFECMSLGIAPVIISDKWQPVETVDWSFAIFIAERDIPRIDAIVRAHEHEWQARGQAALATYRKFFAKTQIASTLHAQIIELQASYSPPREFVMGVASIVRTRLRDVDWVGHKWLKQLILLGYRVTGQPFPFKLYEPLE